MGKKIKSRIEKVKFEIRIKNLFIVLLILVIFIKFNSGLIYNYLDFVKLHLWK